MNPINHFTARADGSHATPVSNQNLINCNKFARYSKAGKIFCGVSN